MGSRQRLWANRPRLTLWCNRRYDLHHWHDDPITFDFVVAPYTSPAWTPLFQLAAAVVVDTGWPLSHADIVAREYRLPVVLGTVIGMQRLGDGQPVRVDAARGLGFLIP